MARKKKPKQNSNTYVAIYKPQQEKLKTDQHEHHKKKNRVDLMLSGELSKSCFTCVTCRVVLKVQNLYF